MKKQVIRLTENDLHKIIENTVKRVIKEKKENNYVQGNLFGDNPEYSEPLGNLEKREAAEEKKKERNKKRREANKEKKYKKENDAKNEFTRKHSMFKESAIRNSIREELNEYVEDDMFDDSIEYEGPDSVGVDLDTYDHTKNYGEYPDDYSY